jgi:hypothetical protein
LMMSFTKRETRMGNRKEKMDNLRKFYMEILICQLRE